LQAQTRSCNCGDDGVLTLEGGDQRFFRVGIFDAVDGEVRWEGGC
jgi:hypothetical protein